MSEVYDLTWYACLLLPESKLSQSSQAYHGFVPKLCHQRGKNTASLKNLTHADLADDADFEINKKNTSGISESVVFDI